MLPWVSAGKIPDEKEKIEQLWFLLEGNESMQRPRFGRSGEAIIISKFLFSRD